MANTFASKLIDPLEKDFQKILGFGKDSTYADIHWGIHLGEDFSCPEKTEVRSIGNGVVVYSDFHPGVQDKKNWGNIIIIAHKKPGGKRSFFSIYGHLGERLVLKGKMVETGEIIGRVGKKNTSENGWWPEEHLHFAIYTGPWKEAVLPGYFKPIDKKTDFKYWKNPSEFIGNYNR